VKQKTPTTEVNNWGMMVAVDEARSQAKGRGKHGGNSRRKASNKKASGQTSSELIEIGQAWGGRLRRQSSSDPAEGSRGGGGGEFNDDDLVEKSSGLLGIKSRGGGHRFRLEGFDDQPREPKKNG